jgi:hypothetical protein
MFCVCVHVFFFWLGKVEFLKDIQVMVPMIFFLLKFTVFSVLI